MLMMATFAVFMVFTRFATFAMVMFARVRAFARIIATAAAMTVTAFMRKLGINHERRQETSANVIEYA
jgi:hypothetical protein